MSPSSLHVENCLRRLNLLYSQWKDPEQSSGTPWEGLDVLLIDIGNTKVNDSISSHKTALQVWLFQTDFPDSLMVFTNYHLNLLASPKHAEYLDKFMDLYQMALKTTTASSIEGAGLFSPRPHINILYKDKADENYKTFDKVLSLLKPLQENKGDRLKFGMVRPTKKESPSTPFLKSWRSVLETDFKNSIKTDIAEAIVCLMGVKDSSELELLRKANVVTNNIFRNLLREEIMTIVDGDCKHSALSDKLEKSFLDPKYIPKYDLKYVDLCYPPIVQSGGNYSMKISQVSTDELIHFGVITCSLGTAYKRYCSNVTRTFLINPSPAIMENYRFLQNVETEVFKFLIPGTTFSQVYTSTLAYIKERKPNLVEKLHPNLGFSIGILFNKQPLSITPNSSIIVKRGMIIHVSVAFCNLENTSAPLDQPKQRNYALMLGDTVVVNENGPATFLAELQQKLSWVSFVIESDASNFESKPKEDRALVGIEKELLGRGLRRAVLESRFRSDQGINEERRQFQKQLMYELNMSAKRRVLSLPSGPDEVDSLTTGEKQFRSYSKPSNFPKVPQISRLKIYVDSQHDTIIFPIFGRPTPFHIATVRNVSTSIEGDYIYLRINFLNPSTTLILEKKTTPVIFQDPRFHFLKELTYRSSTIQEAGMSSVPSENLLQTVRLVKEMHKKYKVKIAEYHESKDVCKQEDLILFSSQKANSTLKNIIARPTVGIGEKIRRRTLSSQTGILEAHKNGLRFRMKAETMDILYKNIQSAIFQPCDLELAAYIHLALANEILISKKRHANVQFYAEVGETVTDLAKYHNCVDREEDRDDYGREERKKRDDLNRRFREFCRFVQSISDVEFEEPHRDMGFPGAPGQVRASVFLQPTSSCLVNVTDWPPFVLQLNDVELVHFERVDFVLRTFDMVFIFKDYNRKVDLISAVPTQRIGKIKQWLDISKIHYTEGSASLNWSKILKTINADPEAFFETGGWTFLEEGDDDEDKNAGDKEEDPQMISDEEYQQPQTDMSSSSDEEEGESTDYSGESSAEDEDLSGSGSDISDMEGKSWDELERLAKVADSNLPRAEKELLLKRKNQGQGQSYYPEKKTKFSFSGSGVPNPKVNGKGPPAPRFKKTAQ